MGRSLAWTFGAGGTIGNTVIVQVSGSIMVGRAFAGCLTGKHATRRQGLATYATPLKLLQVSFYIEHVVKPAAKRAAARSPIFVRIEAPAGRSPLRCECSIPIPTLYGLGMNAHQTGKL